MIPGYQSFRATSKRTRIETRNEDVHGVNPGKLSEQHPREQGLKLTHNHIVLWSENTFRATSKRTRIETFIDDIDYVFYRAFQSNIQENKD